MRQTTDRRLLKGVNLNLPFTIDRNIIATRAHNINRIIIFKPIFSYYFPMA